MAQRSTRKAAPAPSHDTHKTFQLGATLVGILFSIWVYLHNGAVENGAAAESRRHYEKFEDGMSERLRKVWDKINAHEDEAHQAHEQLRRDIEAEMHREIDIAIRDRK